MFKWLKTLADDRKMLKEIALERSNKNKAELLRGLVECITKPKEKLSPVSVLIELNNSCEIRERAAACDRLGISMSSVASAIRDALIDAERLRELENINQGVDMAKKAKPSKKTKKC